MTKYGAYSDLELTALLKGRDQYAFTEIYNRYWPPLFLHVRSMLSDDDLAQDILQELFGSIWQRSAQLEFNVSLSSYLYSAVRNRVFNEIKHEKVKSGRLYEIAAFIEKDVYQADEELRYKDLMQLIEAEVEKMPAKMREIFDLSRNQHLSHKEIAAMLNLSEHTVRTQIQRALRLLRLKLNMSPTLIVAAMQYFIHKS
jgi:RNA polymerase sigma-70 factor (family 1)